MCASPYVHVYICTRVCVLYVCVCVCVCYVCVMCVLHVCELYV